jgi:hypothetical protein
MRAVTTAASVPVTRDELEGDEALETLRRTGRRRVVEATIREIAPGGAGDILTEALRQGSRSSGETALGGGLVAAVLAGTAAMARTSFGMGAGPRAPDHG